MGRSSWRFAFSLQSASRSKDERSSLRAGCISHLRLRDCGGIAVDHLPLPHSKLSKSCVALLILGGLTACNARSSQSDGALDEVQGETREMKGVTEVLIPKSRSYGDTLQIKVVLPSRYIWAVGSEEARRGLTFKPIDYRTLEPVDSHDPGAVGITTYRVTSTYRVGDSGIMQAYQRYPDNGHTRFGLSYRPDPVPGRPEALWKRNYLKPGVSGEEFYIGCTPPIGPGSIIEPTECGMTMMLHRREMNGRPAGIMVNASVPASKIEDWKLIEAAMRKLVEPNIEWVEGDNK